MKSREAEPVGRHGRPKTLVIGWGNELRGDDAAGCVAVRRLAGRNLPGVRAVTDHQLLPEFAEPVAEADLVVFVDACADGRERSRARPLRAPTASGRDAGRPALGHTGGAEGILALAERLYGRRPEAWELGLPARSFDLGARLSPVAAEGTREAESILMELIGRGRGASRTRTRHTEEIHDE
jgi:hydrogenase maturation protease